MHLTDLIPDYKGANNPEISGLTADSRRVEPGWLFAALPGVKTDGARYIADALRAGAAALIGPPGVSLPPEAVSVPYIVSENPRRTFSLIAAKFYGREPETIVAVTGTNGKTSTVTFTQQLWHKAGLRSASLGTLGIRGAGVNRDGALTTPDPAVLHAQLADLAAAGITHLAMEASSHGLDQFRLDGVTISAAAFTNLTRDHLDYHGDMKSYFEAKARLFGAVLKSGGTAVINADIPEFTELRDLCESRGIRVISFGTAAEDIMLENRMPTPDGQDVRLRVRGHTYNFILPLVGAFQIMNALAALGLVMAGYDDDYNPRPFVEMLATLEGVPGRLQLVPGHPRGAAVYVDYAHTPDALQNVLEALRPHTRGRLVCIAGCGGDRDPGKRPVMARIAAELADFLVITDDNPRTEDPAAIRAAMKAAAPQAKEIGGRRAAIEWAVRDLKQGDVLVICGKGHEQGQIIGTTVEPFDDVAVAAEYIESVRT